MSRRVLYTIGAFALTLTALAVTQYVLGAIFSFEGVTLAFLGGLFGGGKTTTTTELDPATQEYVNWMRGVTQSGVNAVGDMGPLFAGPNRQAQMGMGQIGGLQGFQQNPLFQQYLQGMGQMAGGLPAGMENFSGEALQRFMDPYQQQVIGGINAAYDRSGQMALNAAKQQATGAGAYGGTRLGVMQAEALNENERLRNQQVGNTLSQGYGQAVQNFLGNRAYMGGMAQQGLGGLFGAGQYGNAWNMQRGQANMQAGEYARALQERQMQEGLYRQQMMTGMANAGVGPYGTTQTEQKSGNIFGNLLGAGMFAANLFPGIGTGISQLGGALGLGGNIMGRSL